VWLSKRPAQARALREATRVNEITCWRNLVKGTILLKFTN